MNEPVTIKMDKLVMDPSVQIRVRISTKTVEEYAAAMKDGIEFPPIDGFANVEGNIVVADGFHRVLARQVREYPSVKVIVHEGKLEDAVSLALEFGLDQNHKHGLKLTVPDRRNAVKMLLSDERLKKLGDRPIAKKAGVSPATVKSVRAEMHAAPAEKDVEVNPHKRSRPQTRNEKDDEVDPLLEKVRTIREWVESGLIEWPDIRQIFATKSHLPMMVPLSPCKLVTINTGKKQDVYDVSKFEVGTYGEDNVLIATLE